MSPRLHATVTIGLGHSDISHNIAVISSTDGEAQHETRGLPERRSPQLEIRRRNRLPEEKGYAKLLDMSIDGILPAEPQFRTDGGLGDVLLLARAAG